jgi:signal transduction histidine kinase
MTDSQLQVTSRQPSSSPLTAIGGLVAARDLDELALAAALVPAQLLGARECVVLLKSPLGEIVERHPAAIGVELEQWAQSELGSARSDETSRQGQRYLIGIEGLDAGVIAVNLPLADEEASRGLIELGRIVSRCVGQLSSLSRRATALEDARKSIGKGLHDLRTPLNSLRLGLHLLEPGLAGQDPQVVQRTHRAVDRLAALVTEMYEALNEKTATR